MSCSARFRLGVRSTALSIGPAYRSAKGDRDKLALAARLRRETTLVVAQITRRLHGGSWKSLRKQALPTPQRGNERQKEAIRVRFDPFQGVRMR